MKLQDKDKFAFITFCSLGEVGLVLSSASLSLSFTKKQSFYYKLHFTLKEIKRKRRSGK